MGFSPQLCTIPDRFKVAIYLRHMKTILLGEDYEDDVYFFTRALRQVDPDCSVRVVVTGLQVIDYLSGSGLYANRKFFPLPSIVILDLKLPCRTGLEVLEWIRTHSQFHSLPVLMLSNSNLTADIDQAFALAINSYFVKPSTVEGFTEMLWGIYRYWFKLGSFPGVSVVSEVEGRILESDGTIRKLRSEGICRSSENGRRHLPPQTRLVGAGKRNSNRK
jgi:CheY-like chemotaxis protein